MPTLYSDRKTPPPKQDGQPKPKLWHLLVLTVITGLVTWGVLWFRDEGRRATRDQLVGHWVHQGDGVTVELVLKADGHFDRYPKDADIVFIAGQGIPAEGAWHVDNEGVLGFSSGGDFDPFLRGDKLTLQVWRASGSPRYVFTRKKGS